MKWGVIASSNGQNPHASNKARTMAKYATSDRGAETIRLITRSLTMAEPYHRQGTA